MKHSWPYLALILFFLSINYAFAQGYATAQSEVFIINDLAKDGLMRVKDEPLEFSVSSKRPLDVKFIIYHRSALDRKNVTVRGLVKEMAVGEDACPPNMKACPQPHIFLVDSLDDNSPLNYLMVFLSEDDPDEYFAGQTVQIKGKVHASKAAVHLEKI